MYSIIAATVHSPLSFKLDLANVLSAMLAPALLITGTAALISTATTQLARVVDRLRTLMREYDHATEDKTYKGLIIRRQRVRSKLILRAVAFLYTAVAGYVGCSLSLAAHAIWMRSWDFIPAFFAIFGVVMMLAGCLMMWREVSMSMQSFEAEIDYELGIRK